MSDYIPNIKTFQVSPDVPHSLKPLLELANNLWWVWNPDAVELFRRLNRKLWDEVHHNPVKLLATIDQSILVDAAQDQGYMAHLKRVHEAFHKHVDTTGWYHKTFPAATDNLVAYFSAEFGLHESLPIYSGGLGVLAGDHLKSASELGTPLVGVGLMYRNGYFQQYLSADGWQQEAYPELDFYNLAIEPVLADDGSPAKVRVDMPDNPVHARVWKVKIGRIALYLMDTNVPENSPADRDITARLYGTGTDLRIKQELILGIGGVRALEAIGLKPKVYHMNEGHAAFLALERARMLLLEHPELTFDDVRQQVMATCVFTTHTPVPAGIDVFHPDTMRRFFSHFWGLIKLDEDGFLSLGREDVRNRDQGFSMAVLAIRLSDHANGVSQLHGEVSRKMWRNIWPGVPEAEVPIGSITNGIHVRTWLSPDISSTLDLYMGERFISDPADPSVWQGVDQIPDEELWRAHERCRARLVNWARVTLRHQLSERGASYDDIAMADQVLDPEALTIGFARRFATYKRGALVLRDAARIRRIIEDSKHPIQFVFAGKAHPADNQGKELIRTIVNFVRDPAIRRRFVFIENYDMSVARMLVQGVDVWLNTPRRPYEASGTSGMKAAANGVLNCSIPDGWWVEGYGPSVGWSIGRGETYADYNQQDNIESQMLYDIIEKQIGPLFYHRGPDGIPREWVGRMKSCMKLLAPVFNTNRMVADYTKRFYVPAFERGKLLGGPTLTRARALAKKKALYHAKWSGIKVAGVHSSGNGHFRVGQAMAVDALVDLPADLPKGDVAVQLFCGLLDNNGQITKAQTVVMEYVKEMAPGRHLFQSSMTCAVSGRHGFAIRVLPADADLTHPFEPGLIAWN
jgi:starch phosphorylase